MDFTKKARFFFAPVYIFIVMQTQVQIGIFCNYQFDKQCWYKGATKTNQNYDYAFINDSCNKTYLIFVKLIFAMSIAYTIKPRFWNNTWFWNTFTADRNFYNINHLDFGIRSSKIFPKMLIPPHSVLGCESTTNNVKKWDAKNRLILVNISSHIPPPHFLKKLSTY